MIKIEQHVVNCEHHEKFVFITRRFQRVVESFHYIVLNKTASDYKPETVNCLNDFAEKNGADSEESAANYETARKFVCPY